MDCSNRKRDDKVLWNNFINEMKIQLKNYPHNIDEIDSFHELAENFQVRRETITIWIKTFLKNNFSEESKKIYNKIWIQRKGTANKLTYGDIKEFINKKKGKLITSKREFQKMNRRPSKRYVIIKCESGHRFEARVNNFYYLNKWCPNCNEYRCENIMRIEMEKIFGVKFPSTSLHRAYRISGKNGGRLKFDGYN